MSDEPPNYSLSSQKLQLLSELTELKERQSILALEIRSLLEAIRAERKKVSPEKLKSSTNKISLLYSECRGGDNRCAEIYSLLEND